MQVSSGTTFSQIAQDSSFQSGLFKSGDKHVRFSEGKGLYTSPKISTAKLQFWDQGKQQQRLGERMEKRQDGAATIKQAIDREYGAGTGDRVFAAVSQQSGRNLENGVTRKDIALLARALEPGTAAKAALRDPDLQQVTSLNSTYDRTVGFFARHSEAVGHPAFWTSQQAKFNADTFGAGLAFATLDRVTEAGQLTAGDIQKLNESLDPTSIPSGRVAQRLPTTLAGPLDDAARRAIANALFQVYGDADGIHTFNVSGDERDAMSRAMRDPNATGDDRLQAMRDGFAAAIAMSEMNVNNLTMPLSQVPI